MNSKTDRTIDNMSTGVEVSRRDFLRDTARVIGGAVGFTALLYACSPEQEYPLPDQGPNEIWFVGKRFVPEKLTVQLETTVIWLNKDNKPHTITSEDDLFDATLEPGDSFSYTFNGHGNSRYYCRNTRTRGLVFVEQSGEEDIGDEDCEVCHG